MESVIEMEDPASAQWEDWVRVGHYKTLNEAYDRGLVILAMGEACRVAKATTSGEFELQAEAQPAARIFNELDAYEKEMQLSARESSPVRGSKCYPLGWQFSCIWALVLITVFYLQGKDLSLASRVASSSRGLFAEGEWWRPFTGLFLHADLPHLVGNLVAGMIFASLVSKFIGAIHAWALILTCGTIGNLITAKVHYPDKFISLGASTAVFAALGILSGLGLSETLRDRARLPWSRITAPILAGIILLSWLGSGSSSSNTDVLGHVFGFGSGLVAGIAREQFHSLATETS
jgi:rhomboid protease GluP